jgi:hypothetical protein
MGAVIKLLIFRNNNMEITWLEAVKKVLEQLGEPAHLSIISPSVLL